GGGHESRRGVAAVVATIAKSVRHEFLWQVASGGKLKAAIAEVGVVQGDPGGHCRRSTVRPSGAILVPVDQGFRGVGRFDVPLSKHQSSWFGGRFTKRHGREGCTACKQCGWQFVWLRITLDGC